MQTVVVDARGHMLGRLASILAKQLLSGQHVVSIKPERDTNGRIRYGLQLESGDARNTGRGKELMANH